MAVEPRTPVVGGNWKMNLGVAASVELARAERGDLEGLTGVEVAVFPSFPALLSVGKALEGSAIQLGAQTMHEQAAGAFTGEVSAAMLLDVGCRWVILGHSERRRGQPQETSQLVNRKLRAALGAGLRAIVCVGESLAEREAGETEQVVETQVKESLEGCEAGDLQAVVLAYEPVWAIGTGRTATPEQAQAVHSLIRSLFTIIWPAAAGDLRIQYGGSVTPETAPGLMSQPDIDGALVGGASLKADSFASIVRAAAAATSKA